MEFIKSYIIFKSKLHIVGGLFYFEIASIFLISSVKKKELIFGRT